MFFSLSVLLLAANTVVGGPFVQGTSSPPAGTSSSGSAPTLANAKIPAALIVPIDIQLRNLRDGDIEKAYDSTTSKEFKTATSLEEFKDFVGRYPILSKHSSIEVRLITLQDKEANLTAILNPGNEAISVTYLLSREDDKWKIWNMSVTPEYSERVTTLLQNPASMNKIIEDQLESLKEGKIIKAYEEFSSSQFKTQTPLNTFRRFLREFPVLSNYSDVKFRDPYVEKGTGRVEVDISGENAVTTFQYTMGIENNQWKIWNMELLKQVARGVPGQETGVPGMESQEQNIRITQTKQPENGEKKEGPLEITSIELSNQIDSTGKMINPNAPIRSQLSDLHVNVFVRNGVFGAKLTMMIAHVESQSHIPAISTTLSQDGNVEVSFVLTPPQTGWPKGHYTLTVTSSTGASREMSFTVEQR